MNWHVASTGVKSFLHKQNHVIEKFYVKPKVFVFMFHAGLWAKYFIVFYTTFIELTNGFIRCINSTFVFSFIDIYIVKGNL